MGANLNLDWVGAHIQTVVALDQDWLIVVNEGREHASILYRDLVS